MNRRDALLLMAGIPQGLLADLSATTEPRAFVKALQWHRDMGWVVCWVPEEDMKAARSAVGGAAQFKTLEGLPELPHPAYQKGDIVFISSGLRLLSLGGCWVLIR